MLERSSSRRRALRGAQILAGVVAAAFSFDLALAQSPAASGVYNRAASLGSGGFGANGSQQQYGQYGGGRSAALNGGGYGATGYGGAGVGDATALLQVFAQKTIEVSEPEYVYSKHAEKEPIVSIESLDQYAQNSGQDAFLTASGDMTAHVVTLEGKVDVETGEWAITNGRTRKTYKDEHRQGLTDASLSPDSKYVLTASYDEKGRLWTIDNQKNIRAYLGAKDRLWAIEATPSGEYVAAACNDGRVYFWNSLTVEKCFDENDGGANVPNRQDCSAKGEEFVESGHEGPIYDLAFSPDSQYCATAGADGTVRVWDVGTALQKWIYKNQVREKTIDAAPREIVVINGHQDKVYSVRFSDDGGYILTASRDKTARLWNAFTGEEVCRFVGHTGAVRKAVFDGAEVLTASDDGTVKLWSTGSASNAGANGPNAGSSSLGPGAASSYPGSTGPGATSSYPGSTGPGVSSSYPGSGSSSNPNGGQAANVEKPTRAPGKAKGTELVSFDAGSPVFSVASSLDGVYVLGGCADGTIKIWRVPGMSRYFDLFGNGAGPNGPNQNAYSGEIGGLNRGYGTGSASGPNASSGRGASGASPYPTNNANFN